MLAASLSVLFSYGGWQLLDLRRAVREGPAEEPPEGDRRRGHRRRGHLLPDQPRLPEGPRSAGTAPRSRRTDGRPDGQRRAGSEGIGATFVTAAMAVSALGFLVATLITTPGIYVAMSTRRGIFFRGFAGSSSRRPAPHARAHHPGAAGPRLPGLERRGKVRVRRDPHSRRRLRRVDLPRHGGTSCADRPRQRAGISGCGPFKSSLSALPDHVRRHRPRVVNRWWRCDDHRRRGARCPSGFDAHWLLGRRPLAAGALQRTRRGLKRVARPGPAPRRGAARATAGPVPIARAPRSRIMLR